jgi:hypothetical protein
VQARLRQELADRRAAIAAGSPQLGPSEDPQAHLARVRREVLAAGQATGEGLSKGMLTSAPLASKAGETVAMSAADGTKRALGVHSPSKLFAEFGRMTAAGFVEGIDSSARDVDEAVAAIFAPPGRGTAAPTAGGGPISISIPIQVTIAGGATPETAQQIGEALGDQLGQLVPSALQSALAQLALQTGGG